VKVTETVEAVGTTTWTEPLVGPEVIV